MKIKQIRNATLRVEYGGKVFLVDPWLAERWRMGCMADIPGRPFRIPDPAKELIPMPICGLPEPVAKILGGVDYYIVTHIHPDHIDMSPDGTVGSLLDKAVPVLVQNEEDAEVFRKSGFQSVTALHAAVQCGAVSLTKTPAQHGVVAPCGEACGVMFQTEGEKTLYIAGDTVWYSGVKDTLKKFQPDIVVVNACAAELTAHGRLIMNDEDVEAVAKTLPRAKIVISHMDTVAHASITRHSMRGLLAARGVAGYAMPEDGEILQL